MGMRELPNDFEAEQAVLGSMLISNYACSEVIGRLNSDDFYQESHRLIYGAMLSLYDASKPIDAATVIAHLRDMNQLEKAGGVEYLVVLSESVPTTEHVEHYAKMIEEKSSLRRLIRQAENIVSGAYQEIEDVDQFISDSAISA